jgi:hypothetical protein
MLETVAPSAIGFHDDETPIALDKRESKSDFRFQIGYQDP